MRAMYAPLMDYLGDKLGISIEIVIPPSYEALLDMVSGGELDLISFNSVTYLKARRQGYSLDYLATLPTCQVFERNTARYCDEPDDFSQRICREIGGAGRIPDQPYSEGPYAKVPCVVSEEDGRIGRKTGESLDSLPDEREEEVPP